MSSRFATPAWLITQVGLPPALMKKLEPYISTRSQVFRFQSIGYFDKDGPASRIEAVVDTGLARPHILYRRDLSELGKGDDLTNAN